MDRPIEEHFLLAMLRYETLARADVGRPTINAFGKVWPVSGFIGRILPTDVGKRIYLFGGVLQVESNEQQDKRLA